MNREWRRWLCRADHLFPSLHDLALHDLVDEAGGIVAFHACQQPQYLSSGEPCTRKAGREDRHRWTLQLWEGVPEAVVVRELVIGAAHSSPHGHPPIAVYLLAYGTRAMVTRGALACAGGLEVA